MGQFKELADTVRAEKLRCEIYHAMREMNTKNAHIVAFLKSGQTITVMDGLNSNTSYFETIKAWLLLIHGMLSSTTRWDLAMMKAKIEAQTPENKIMLTAEFQELWEIILSK